MTFAKNEKVDLIVVGTKGRCGIKNLLIGSVAKGVVDYAHCPVLVVR
jgi:universal stress protein A